jgi:uncharacterized RDD family membrane protein YckC
MGHACPHCGAANRPTSLWCALCHAPLHQNAPKAAAAPVRTGSLPAPPIFLDEEALPEPPGDAAPSSEPQWRLEVSRKLDAYRVRRGLRPPDPPQAQLPFPAVAKLSVAEEPKPAPRPRAAERRRERVEIFVNQPDLDFPAGVIPSPNHALVPVAGVVRRTVAWMADAGFLLTSWAMFLGLLTALGVSLTASKLDLAICVAVLCLLYVQYFGLFTAFGGITPGMRLLGLRVVSFDGNLPTPKQLLWRSFGYLVAGGAGCLGFVSALWDDDRLCWQDRVSQTYLTALPIVPLPEEQAVEERR